MQKISIGLGGFYYFNFSLLEILIFLRQFNGFNGVEIHVKHGYKFLEEEIEELRKYKYNTIHLHNYNKNDETWFSYCIQTIPNFQHFVLHPDNINLDDINKNFEKYISFENMDLRKDSFQTAGEMKKLFELFPKSKFTLDINHLEENNINIKTFDIIKKPSQIHFSVVNKNYYKDYPEIDTPHALACLEKGFNFNLRTFKDCIITTEGLYLKDRPELIQKEIDLIKNLFK